MRCTVHVIEPTTSEPRSKNHRKPRRRHWLGVVCLGFLSQAVPGCLYDPDKPCGDGMDVYGDNERCVCPPGAAYTATGCVTCGAHEVASASGCACEDGYSRPTANAACVETPTDLGSACDPAAPDCPTPYDHCEPAADGGYCTTAGCTTTEDCKGGYACNADSVCQRPPNGLGSSCTTPDDCAGTEATFCDTFMTHSCQVQGCAFDPDSCFPGFECCDLSAFGLPQPLCIPQGACAP
jgi:hypothetical protein